MTKSARESDPSSYISAEASFKNIREGRHLFYSRVHEVWSDDNKGFEENAEIIYTLLNGHGDKPNPLSTKHKQRKIKSLGVGHTSMSVGDFIAFGENTLKILVADTFGFKEVAPTKLWYTSMIYNNLKKVARLSATGRLTAESIQGPYNN
tara:strand:- start:33 stop:482 length:450 start_codon:yes stop_codon:yes gene_type:complete